MNSDNKVKIIESISGEVLFQCEIEQIEAAYKYFSQLEEMDISAQIKVPTLNKTLATSLGVTDQQWNDYEESMEEEMEDHDCSSCC